MCLRAATVSLVLPERAPHGYCWLRRQLQHVLTGAVSHASVLYDVAVSLWPAVAAAAVQICPDVEASRSLSVAQAVIRVWTLRRRYAFFPSIVGLLARFDRLVS